MQRARAGDGAAFARLHAAFARTVHGVVLAQGRGLDAEDVTQEVFVTAFERLDELRDDGAFPGWLCAAARNAAVSALRRQRPRGDAELAEIADGARGPELLAEQRDAAERVLECVRSLPDAYRETLVLRLCEGLTGPEIAARTGRTHGSVRVNLTRGMALLRPLLQEAGLP